MASVPATMAPIERVFSRASYILSKKDYDWYAYMHMHMQKLHICNLFGIAYMHMQCNMHSFLNMQYANFAY